MNVLFDTTFLVEIDRKKPEAIKLAKKLVSKDAQLWISSITVAEITAGAYLRKDYEKSMANARTALSMFDWKDFDSDVAAITGEMLAYQISIGKPISFQDTAIAATAIQQKADLVITENKKHFTIFPKIKNKIKTIKEAL